MRNTHPLANLGRGLGIAFAAFAFVLGSQQAEEHYRARRGITTATHCLHWAQQAEEHRWPAPL